MPYLSVAHGRSGGPFSLYYDTRGDGQEKILFINGMGGITSQWDDQIQYFINKKFHCCVFDNRGSGMSDSPDVYYSTFEMALDALELLRFLGWSRVHLIGLSMGGMIAQELALLLGSNVSSLILESTYSKFPGLPAKAISNIIFAKPSNSLDDFVERVVPLLFPEIWLNAPCDPIRGNFSKNRDLATEYFKSRYSITGLQDPTGRFRQQFACLTHYVDYRLEDIKNLKFPILVITGDSDDVTRQPLGCRILAQKLNADLKVYAGGGHAIRYQDPDWHNTHCYKFLLKAIRNLELGKE